MRLRDATCAARENPQTFRAALDAKIAKIHSENIRLNAFLGCYFSRETPPRLLEKLIEQKKDLPLFGAAFAVKDNIRVKGRPLTFGLRPPLESQAHAHAAIVELLIRKGATLLGSTNLDAACLDCCGDNPYYGNVINPRYPERIPAGSSGGSAAAVAAGCCNFAVGSDFGGSIRAPAAACVLYGMKSSPDLLPPQGALLYDPRFDTLGFLTPGLDDMLYLYECLRSEHCAPLPQKIQFVVPAPFELGELDEGIRADFDLFLQKLRSEFTVHQLDFEIGFEQSLEVRKIIAASEFEALARRFRLEEATLPDTARAVLAYEKILSPAQKENAQDRQAALAAKLSAMLDPAVFIITPALPALPPSRSSLSSGRDSLPSKRLNRFLALANVCLLPALSMPLEDTLSKFPFSLQIIGAPGCDYQLLEAARQLKTVNLDS